MKRMKLIMFIVVALWASAISAQEQVKMAKEKRLAEIREVMTYKQTLIQKLFEDNTLDFSVKKQRIQALLAERREYIKTHLSAEEMKLISRRPEQIHSKHLDSLKKLGRSELLQKVEQPLMEKLAP